MSQRISLLVGFFGEQKTPAVRPSDREAGGVSPRSTSIPILKGTLKTDNLFLNAEEYLRYYMFSVERHSRLMGIHET